MANYFTRNKSYSSLLCTSSNLQHYGTSYKHPAFQQSFTKYSFKKFHQSIIIPGYFNLLLIMTALFLHCLTASLHPEALWFLVCIKPLSNNIRDCRSPLTCVSSVSHSPLHSLVLQLHVCTRQVNGHSKCACLSVGQCIGF